MGKLSQRACFLAVGLYILILELIPNCKSTEQNANQISPWVDRILPFDWSLIIENNMLI